MSWLHRSPRGRLSPILYLLASLFFALGAMGVWFELSALRFLGPWLRWPTHTCTIDSSEVVPEEDHYRAVVRYHYEVDGIAFEGDRIFPGYDGLDPLHEALGLIAPYPAGAAVECRIDPEDPAWAALDVLPWGRMLRIHLIVFGIFAVGGYGLCWLELDAARARRRLALLPSEEHLARPLPRPLLFLYDAGIPSLLLVVGGVLLWLTAQPLVHVVQWAFSLGWKEVPCTIEWISVETHSTPPSTEDSSMGRSSRDTYSVAVLYSYEVDGRARRSNRFDFAGGSSSNSSRAHSAVQHHPVGPSTCWVSPFLASSAVVERRLGFHWAIPLLSLLASPIGLLVCYFGALGIVDSVSNARRKV